SAVTSSVSRTSGVESGAWPASGPAPARRTSSAPAEIAGTPRNDVNIGSPVARDMGHDLGSRPCGATGGGTGNGSGARGRADLEGEETGRHPEQGDGLRRAGCERAGQCRYEGRRDGWDAGDRRPVAAAETSAAGGVVMRVGGYGRMGGPGLRGSR